MYSIKRPILFVNMLRRWEAENGPNMCFHFILMWQMTQLMFYKKSSRHVKTCKFQFINPNFAACFMALSIFNHKLSMLGICLVQCFWCATILIFLKFENSLLFLCHLALNTFFSKIWWHFQNSNWVFKKLLLLYSIYTLCSVVNLSNSPFQWLSLILSVF